MQIIFYFNTGFEIWYFVPALFPHSLGWNSNACFFLLQCFPFKWSCWSMPTTAIPWPVTWMAFLTCWERPGFALTAWRAQRSSLSWWDFFTNRVTHSHLKQIALCKILKNLSLFVSFETFINNLKVSNKPFRQSKNKKVCKSLFKHC